MRILAIETSSPPGSIAISVDGQVRAQEFTSVRRTTELFAASIQELLKTAGLRPSDIDLVATTLGPGSFTGIRIGITVAKVFAHAVNARLVAVNTLELLANQFADSEQVEAATASREIEAVLDAQRGELFAARFRITDNTIEELIPTEIIAADDWIASRTANATLTGTGLKKILERLPGEATLADEQLWKPSAETLVRIAEAKLAECESKPLTLVPRYFRRSAAEEKADRSD